MKYNQREFLKVQKQTAKEDIYYQATSLGETSPDFCNNEIELRRPLPTGFRGALEDRRFCCFFFNEILRSHLNSNEREL